MTGPAPPVVRVRDLHVAYGTTEVVHGIDLDVGAGEVVALLGPNGAGKTTTVEVLEGHRRRSGGEVRVLGLDPVRGGRALRERIGIVLQEAGLDGELRVRESLELFAGLYPHPRPVDEVLAWVELGAKRSAPVRTLSGGQRRRLDLALGLVGDPELVFLDEPTTGFDPAARRQAWSLLDAVRARGTTILLTSHYMDEVQRLADRVVVMSAGRVIEVASPASLGGRDRGRAEIRFRLPHGASIADLPRAGGWVSRLDDRDVVVLTDRPTAALAVLTAWALGRGGELEGLTVSRPSLEEVLLDLTSSVVGASP